MQGKDLAGTKRPVVGIAWGMVSTSLITFLVSALVIWFLRVATGDLVGFVGLLFWIVICVPMMLAALTLLVINTVRYKQWSILALAPVILVTCVAGGALLFQLNFVAWRLNVNTDLASADYWYLPFTDVAIWMVILATPSVTLIYGLWRRHTRSLNSAFGAVLVIIITLSTFSWFGAPRIVQTTPSGPIKVTVASTPKVDCAHGVYPPITVTWLETGAPFWVVHVNADFPVTATPSSAPTLLTPEQSIDITLSGARPPSSRWNKIVVAVVVPGSGYPGNNPGETVTLTC